MYVLRIVVTDFWNLDSVDRLSKSKGAKAARYDIPETDRTRARKTDLTFFFSSSIDCYSKNGKQRGILYEMVNDTGVSANSPISVFQIRVQYLFSVERIEKKKKKKTERRFPK